MRRREEKRGKIKSNKEEGTKPNEIQLTLPILSKQQPREKTKHKCLKDTKITKKRTIITNKNNIKRRAERNEKEIINTGSDISAIMGQQPELEQIEAPGNEKQTNEIKERKKTKRQKKIRMKALKHLKQLYKDVIREVTINKSYVLQIAKDPIEYQKIDVIVCPTRSTQLRIAETPLGKQLIHRGGTEIERECKLWIDTYGRLKEGVAVTTGGHLRAKYIVYPKIPIYFGAAGVKDDKQMLFGIYNALLAAHKLLVKSIVMPIFSETTFDYPAVRSVCLIYHAILLFWSNFPKTTVKLIRLTTAGNTHSQYLLEAEHERRFGKLKYTHFVLQQSIKDAFAKQTPKTPITPRKQQ